MKSLLITVIWLIIFIKELLFWLWLWQLKEYHRGRFRAHFETQRFKKFFSSFWRLKSPKLTKKIIFLLVICFFTEVIIIYYLSFLWVVILTVIFIPLFVLFFQIPTAVWRKFIINKAKQKRAKFRNLLVVGITGSYGKTSTKEFLATILAEKFGENKVLKTKENQNSEIGIAQCILNDLKSEHQIFVCEIGAYNIAKIKEVCGFIKPKIGILTGINEQHMATFGSQENIINAKYELIESLPADGIAFFNSKNKYCLELYNKTKLNKKFLYGGNATFFGEENLLGAMAVAWELGMKEDEISRAVNKIENKFGGIQIKKGIDGLNIIDATYSANPDGVLAHLEYLKNFVGKKIIVMPCLIELGKASKEIHRRIGKKIAEVCDLAIITTKDRFKEIRTSALSAENLDSSFHSEFKKTAREKVIFLENPKQIIEKVKTFTNSGDVILLESRVPQELIASLVS